MIEEERRDRLFAFLDGELPAAGRSVLEAELALDAELAEELAVFTRLDRELRGALSPLGATDEAIAAAVLARSALTAGLGGMDRARAARRGILAALALAAAILLAVRAIPLPDRVDASRWLVASRDGSAMWVDESAPRKDPVRPGALPSGNGELFTIDGRGAVLRDPSGAEVLLAPRSALAISNGRATFLGGSAWVRGESPLPIDVAGARIEGRGSFAIEERGSAVVVSVLAGEVAVRRGERGDALLGAGTEIALGGKGGDESRVSRGAILRLGWAVGAIAELEGAPDELPAPGSAIIELIDGHIAALADDELGSVALKGISGWIGAAAVPRLSEALRMPTKTPGSPYRERLAMALREAVGGGKLPAAAVEPLFELPLDVEEAILGDVIDSLAAATGFGPVPSTEFWVGKSAPRTREEREKALAAWREKWRDLRP